jgi:DNA-binding transcriptional MocR family regulator
MSKIFWTGLRIGWVRAAPAIITRLTRLKVVNDLGSGLVNQFIANRWLEKVEQVKLWRKQELLPGREQTIRLLQEHLPEWEYNRPGGGLFLWVKLAGSNAGAFAQLALRYGVVILPGNMMSADESYGQYIRLPFFQDRAIIEEGLIRLSQAWQAQGLLSRASQPALNFIV